MVQTMAPDANRSTMVVVDTNPNNDKSTSLYSTPPLTPSSPPPKSGTQFPDFHEFPSAHSLLRSPGHNTNHTKLPQSSTASSLAPSLPPSLPPKANPDTVRVGLVSSALCHDYADERTLQSTNATQRNAPLKTRTRERERSEERRVCCQTRAPGIKFGAQERR